MASLNNDSEKHSRTEGQAATASHIDLEPVSTQRSVDEPPDGGYGWVCAVCLLFINAHTWGVNSAWGIFLARYLEDSYFSDASQFTYAIIGGLSISQSLMVSPLVGWANRKLGTKISMLIGTALVSLSFLTSSFATKIWHLCLAQGCCFGYGMGFLYLTSATIVPQWFTKKRSLAVGLASSGAGFGGIVYNLAVGAAIPSLGLPWTYRLLALLTFVVNLICSVLLKDRNQVVTPENKKLFNFQEFGHISILLLIAWGVFTELGYIVLLYSLPNYAQSIGLTAQQGSVVGAVLNVGLGFGRPAVGFMSDRFGRINVATILTAYCGICCLALWVPANSYALLIVFALLAGTACGTFWGCIVPVVAEVTGLQRMQSAFFMVCLPLVVPTIFAQPVALGLKSSSGYLTSQVFVGCIYLVAASSMWALRSWKICEVEKKESQESDWPQPSAWFMPRRLFARKNV